MSFLVALNVSPIFLLNIFTFILTEVYFCYAGEHYPSIKQ